MRRLLFYFPDVHQTTVRKHRCRSTHFAYFVPHGAYEARKSRVQVVQSSSATVGHSGPGVDRC